MSNNPNSVATTSDNPNFVAVMSSDEIYFGQDATLCITDVVNDKADADHTHDGVYATTNHTHDGYASQADLDLLEDVVNTKANTTHTHSEYANVNHVHSDYATQVALDTLAEEVDGKANASHTHEEYADVSHTHTEYAESSHIHENYALTTHTHIGFADEAHTHTEYAEVNHSHSNYALTTHDHDSDYASYAHTHTASEVGAAASGHDHDEDYAQLSHSHTDYATTTALNEVSAAVSGKANAYHTHNDIYYTETEIDTKLAGKADSSHNHAGVYDVSGAAASALTSANAYTDSKIDALVGEGASTTLDTIGEISSAIEDNQDAIDLLNSAIANKANATDLTSHTGNTAIHVTEDNKNNWGAAYTHSQVAHAPSNAEVNQNAFSNIVIGNTTISADTKTDTLTLIAGNNITLTPSAENDSVTIAATNTVYTHPATAGNKHIPAGGSSGQILRWSADGTAVWGADNNTTYSVATETSNGLMSADDKGKLNSIAENANNYVLPSAGSSLGGVKTGGDVTIASGVITVNDDSHNHVISNIDGLQSALDGKASSSHTHSYAGSSSAGGAATSANKLNTNAGSATQPIYFANGVPVVTTYTLGASVPSGAKFTDTTYGAVTTSANGLMIASDKSKLDGMVLATVSEVETYLAI